MGLQVGYPRGDAAATGMARVIWSPNALLELDLIRAYIAQFDNAAAARIYRGLFEAGNSLEDFPNRGRPASGNRRELPTVPPYVIRYVVSGEIVFIQGVRHGAGRPH